MIDVSNIMEALKHHAFIKNEMNRECAYCPYDEYGEECETQLAKDVLLLIETYRKELDK